MSKENGLSMTSEYGIKRIRANNISRGMKEIFCFSRRLDYSFPGMEKAAITRGALKLPSNQDKYCLLTKYIPSLQNGAGQGYG